MIPQAIILFDDAQSAHLKPLTFCRPAAALQSGPLTAAAYWQKISNLPIGYHCDVSLSKLFPSTEKAESYIHINGRALAGKKLWEQIEKLQINQKLIYQETLIAYRSQLAETVENIDFETIESDQEIQLLKRPADLFRHCASRIQTQLHLFSGYEHPQDDGYNRFKQADQIFVHPTADLSGVIINASDGPVIIDEGAKLLEGTLVKGPTYIGKHAVIKMGAKIYGSTIISDHCKVGGEISNVVFHPCSNKGHDGYLGNSVIGSWCNLGADTNCSNLKNNYSEVKTWNYATDQYENSGTIFHGLIMGDHSKCSINTMFNTGTVVGIFANIFGAGFPSKFVPSYSWGSDDTYDFEKAIEVAKTVMARRKVELKQEEIELLKHIYNLTEKYRKS